MSSYKKVTVKELMDPSQELVWVGQSILLNGHIHAIRVQGEVLGFLSVMDSTTCKHMQVIVNVETSTDKESTKEALLKLKKGAMVTIKGQIVACPESNNKEQKTELRADSVQMYGVVDAATYPLAKHKQPLETIRHVPHLRFKDKRITAVNIIRNKASMLIHKFFQLRDYQWAHTPLLTANDCEGAGETFHIWCDQDEKILMDKIKQDTLKELEDSKEEEPKEGEELKEGEADKEEPKEGEEVKDELELAPKKKTFFSSKVHLTVSGQLHGEAFAHGLSKIYTFGPTFRADPSETSRHLAEFWMVEPEICFIDFTELKTIAEEFVKFVVSGILSSHMDEIAYLDTITEQNLVQTLNTIAKEDFAQLSYTDAIKKLEADIADHKIRVVDSSMSPKQLRKLAKKQYLITEAPYWGMDLKSEHERYFTDVIFQKPVIIYHYPKSLKPFYMKTSDVKYEEGEVVDAMDILIPNLGELIGGSMREADYEKLKEAMIKDNLMEELDWYLELRKYGSVPHGGFGLGFERLLMILTGMTSIRDVISFPRYSHHCFA